MYIELLRSSRIDLGVECEIQCIGSALDGKRNIEDWVLGSVKRYVAKIEVEFLLVENCPVSLHLIQLEEEVADLQVFKQ
jgi:hypothetical protein